MTRWCERALSLIAAGEPAVLVTICATMGSAPREAGAKMLVWQSGQNGTIGGGNLEFIVTDQARKLLASDSAYRVQDYPLGPFLAQCCGGHVRLLLERIDASSKTWLEATLAAADSNRSVVILSEVQGNISKRIMTGSDALAWQRSALGECDAPAVAILDEKGRRLIGTKPVHDDKLTIFEMIQPNLHELVMFGAGHVGQAVARLVETLPFRVTWLDSREAMQTTDPAAPIPVQFVLDPVVRVDHLPPNALHLVFTHSHDVDYRLVRAILSRGDFAYCGLIGSATKRARFESRLARDGLAELAIARLTCPIGAIGLTSKSPEIVAVGIAAELLLAIQHQDARATAPARTVPNLS
jgi:xanthine dehydrogenase accessory factor